nr:MAG TPA: hypothetical protein [Bacteriophage sp.]
MVRNKVALSDNGLPPIFSYFLASIFYSCEVFGFLIVSLIALSYYSSCYFFQYLVDNTVPN